MKLFDLPKEIFLHIASFLKGTELLPFLLTNKRYYTLLKENHKDYGLFLKATNTLKGEKLSINSHPTLKGLTLNERINFLKQVALEKFDFTMLGFAFFKHLQLQFSENITELLIKNHITHEFLCNCDTDMLKEIASANALIAFSTGKINTDSEAGEKIKPIF